MRENSMWFAFGATVLISVVLSVAPLPINTPDWVAYLRPEWVILIWYFWLVFQSERCSLLLAFAIGLLLDVMLDEPFGLNALLLISLQYVGHLGLRFLHQSPGIRSALMLLVLVSMTNFTKCLVLLVAIDVKIDVLSLIMPPLVTVVFWLPFITLLSSESSQLTQEVE